MFIHLNSRRFGDIAELCQMLATASKHDLVEPFEMQISDIETD